MVYFGNEIRLLFKIKKDAIEFMIDFEQVNLLINFIKQNDGINDKQLLTQKVKEQFSLISDRKVYYCENFAIRFSKATSETFSNTVLSLSTLQKYDDRPVIICVVLPKKNYMLLANTTFLKKISHSSQQLRVDNIRGSFNGSDILRVIADVSNEPDNFEKLFAIHQGYTFEENLVRLVETTNNIVASGHKFSPSDHEIENIKNAPSRSRMFLQSNFYKKLSDDLQERVAKVSNEIAIAAFIENVNIRGNIIEYLITSNNETVKSTLIDSLRNRKPLPQIKNKNDLGDYNMDYGVFDTKTDIKTKVLFLGSNPKAYNIDKLLKFLAKDNSVYLLFFVGVDKDKSISTFLCPVFDKTLLDNTVIISHWAGRNSKGVAQFYGENIGHIIKNKSVNMDEIRALAFLDKLLAL